MADLHWAVEEKGEEKKIRDGEGKSERSCFSLIIRAFFGQGEDVLSELRGLVCHLPALYEEAVVALRRHDIGEAIDFYRQFVSLMNDVGAFLASIACVGA